MSGDPFADRIAGRRGDYQCDHLDSETGRRCLFPADTQTAEEDPRYATPPEPYRCGRHTPGNEVVRNLLEEEHRARVAAMPPPVPHRPVTDTPACWSWLVTDEIRELLRLAADESLPSMERINAECAALEAFDGGLCAICGNGGGPRVEDHCHWTGRTRGWLCRSCNVREGKDRDPDSAFAKYRRRHPMMMLDLDQPYHGYGWEMGEPVGGWWPGWGEPPETEAEMWANHPMRGVL